MKFIYILVLFTSILFSANHTECLRDNRIESYTIILKTINKIQKELPALTTKENLFYQQVSKNQMSNYPKYKKIMDTNEYIIYKISSQLDYIKTILKMTLMYSKNKTIHSLVEETKNLSILVNKLIKYNSSISKGFSESQVLYNRNIVNKDFFIESQNLVLFIWNISDCISKKLIYDIRDSKLD